MRRLQSAGMASLLFVLAARAAVGQCCGDCDGSGQVTISEIITAVNIGLELIPCNPSVGQRLPASGQTTSYGTSSDGDVRAGAVLSYTDNGDGTITDNNTALTWEKKDRSGGVHDMENRYTWGRNDEPYTINGTMVTEFLATLNTPPCFAGHCDWRIPNVKELQSIVDYENYDRAVSAPFDANCIGGCTVDGDAGPICSCTASSDHWSSSTFASFPNNAWVVNFSGGNVIFGVKTSFRHVRAVRDDP